MWHTPRFPERILVSLRDRGPTGSRRSSHRRRSTVFRLERLEERTVLSTLTVLNCLDSGPGSLRATIAAASPGDTINFDKSVKTITLSTELVINLTPGSAPLDIEGPGPNKLKISGNDSSRVFDIQSGSVKIAGLTVTDGLANGDTSIQPSVGGGVLNSGNGKLELINDVLSNNQAVGDASGSAGGFNGGALGGAIETDGQLTVTDCQFINNQALGADGSSGVNIAGIGTGGAIDSGGDVSITDSLFAGNVARGGNNCNGDRQFGTLGIGYGGAILNTGLLTVTGSTFRHNQAIGGNNNVSARFSGEGTGGAIGSGGPGGPLAVLIVSGSSFDHNVAVGGNGNKVTPPTQSPLLPPGYGPNSAGGGAISINQASGTIENSTFVENSTFDHNQALGGKGEADKNDGGYSAGGALSVFALISDVYVTVSGCTVDHNDAIGGPGGSGGNGGDGVGGGIASVGKPSDAPPPPGPHSATLAVEDTTVEHNTALGGYGFDGGNGWGGGLYNGALSKLTLTGATVQFNFAAVVGAGRGGSDGEGIGGGVYNLGVFAFDPTSVIKKNHASTSNDDIFS